MIRHPLPHAKASALAARSSRAFSQRAMGLLGLLVVSMAAAVACTLNPQPLPPATATKDGGAFGSPNTPPNSTDRVGEDGSGEPTSPAADAGSGFDNEYDGGINPPNRTDGGTDAGDGGADAGDAGDGGADAGDAG
jgi:hypothetical protein